MAHNISRTILCGPGRGITTCVTPTAQLVTLRAAFASQKSFLVPDTFRCIRTIRGLLSRWLDANLLVVAHTDGKGRAAVNDPLSVQRAKATRAFLQGDADTWLGFYRSPTPAEQQWGATEDGIMMNAVPTRARREQHEDPIHWFQRTRGLERTGKLSPSDRKALIEEYMAVPSDGFAVSPQVRVEVVGAGANFPERGLTATQLRRADVLLFPQTGVTPPVVSPLLRPHASEYQRWLRGAERYPCGSIICSPSSAGTGKIIVRVKHRDGSGVKGATVGIVLGPSRPLNLTTDPDGNVMFERLAAGRYIVGASMGPRFIGQRVVESLQDGVTERREITLVEDTTLTVAAYWVISKRRIHELDADIQDAERRRTSAHKKVESLERYVADKKATLKTMKEQDELDKSTPKLSNDPGKNGYKVGRGLHEAIVEREIAVAEEELQWRRAGAEALDNDTARMKKQRQEMQRHPTVPAQFSRIEISGPSSAIAQAQSGTAVFRGIRPGAYSVTVTCQDGLMGKTVVEHVTVLLDQHQRKTIYLPQS